MQALNYEQKMEKIKKLLKKLKEREEERKSEQEQNDALTEISWVEHSVPKTDFMGNDKGMF